MTRPSVDFGAPSPFDLSVPVVIVGAGGGGLCAALAAAEAGAEVVVLEREPTVAGTTAMSSGLIPAAATRAQRAAGVVDDTPEIFAADLVRKAGGLADPVIVRRLAEQSTLTVDWLIDGLGLPLTLVPTARLPGHSRPRLHGSPNRSGAELMAALHQACRDRGIDIVTDARVDTLFADADGRVRGVAYSRPDGAVEAIGCQALVLASCGFAANAALVGRHIPGIAASVAHTHPGAQGDALAWGEALGAATADLSGYQGHASLAHGHGLLIHWIVMSEGAVQVNLEAERFADESRGYSEMAVEVLAQAGGVAWNIYDQRIHRLMQEFEEYRDAMSAGAIREGRDVAALAAVTGLPEAPLRRSLEEVARLKAGAGADALGRDFTGSPPLHPPYFAVKVTGAIFHTQGGLVVDGDGRVLRPDGRPLPNLFAVGGAARGVSGPEPSGYLAGNGLLTATTLGRLAGAAAARLTV